MKLGQVLSLGVLVASTTGCRPAIEPATVAAQAVAAPGAGVTACWVETSARFSFTASAIVIRHPDGDLLIDAGNSTEFDEEIKPYTGGTKMWLALFPGSLEPRRSIAEELTAVSVEPDGLRWVLPTHAHLDHLGGVLDLPPTPVLMDPAEAQVVEAGQHEPGFAVIPAHARAVAPHVVTLTMVEERYEVFERHADLFGDGSVVVVPLPGHTPGSVGVFVRLADGRRVFHVGDAVNNRRQIEKLRGRSLAMRRTDADRPRADKTVARLHALAELDSSILLLPAHERAAWRDIFGDPNQSCPAPS